jgi:hypothetical protein
MRLRFAHASLALPVLLSGCLLQQPADRIVYSPCHAVATANWRAWVERINVSRSKAPLHRSFLFVEGDVTVAGEGWQASLARGPVEQLGEPVQQLIIRTSGSGTGLPVVRHVAGRFAPLERYGAIAIRCGDGLVATIPVVPRKS